jgi:hypothetical protein
MENTRRGRGRPKLTWAVAVTRGVVDKNKTNPETDFLDCMHFVSRLKFLWN